ncbi:MerR family transcriptional regulator [Microbacterium sp. NEAU-LLC]|uniref:MerR family transcriptional regulator n=1 Tax=Microbacterium helvum TaxID=2773713 RepID=A0ABR8NSH6_9MICO|nr:MerR family transcriptional regulator [Microbacterium helvum]MBD3943591.1 MerR family transcriptional regulator [Microbacterium helvum]
MSDVELDPDRGVYGISVAAELAGSGVQNLRAYEAHGLLLPDRSAGGTRRYSVNDVVMLRRIGELLDAGLNLAGIAMVIPLQDENRRLRAKEGATVNLERTHSRHDGDDSERTR